VTAPPLLRPYQTDVVAKIETAIAAGQKRLLLVAPTGSGKTIVFCDVIKRFIEQYKTVLVIAHRHEIIQQVSYGIIQAGIDPRPMASVQVASIATMWMRCFRSKTMPLPPADLVVIDEAHHTPAPTYRKIIDAYPDAVVLGVTATPCRGDGRGLGGIFEAMIECPQVAALIEQRHLVRSTVYTPVKPDLKGVRTVAGDYVEGQLAERMDRPKLVGDIVTHWHKFGERRRTVAFAVSVSHSIHLRDEFVRSGVRAEHIDGSTPKEERDAILERLASGETEVVVNCMVLTEGFDCPDIGCIILARPTKKMGLYRQMVGRGLRTAKGKSNCVILDHSGTALQHGLPEEHVTWRLDPDHRAVAPAHQARLKGLVTSRLIGCKQCSALRLGGQPCPNCGFLPKRPGQYLHIRDGELALFENGKVKPPIHDRTTRENWHGMLASIAKERGYKAGWAAHKYKEKFGAFPAWGITPELITPTPEVTSWVRSRQIAYAKALERGTA
jgi:DNA repair protein RadD